MSGPSGAPGGGRAVAVWAEALAERRAAGLLRRLDGGAGSAATRLQRGGRSLLNLSSNNTLGLAGHPELVAAARAALEAYGVGAGASRLITGNHAEYATLERELAEWKGCEAALVFQSGYHANTGVLGGLFGRDDLIVADKWIHASLIDGAKLAGAKLARFRHNDVAHAAALLARRGEHRLCALVTESVFSMEGDLAPLGELAELAAAHDAVFIVDEAHGAGLFGPEGRGLAAALGVEEAVDVQVGTLSKAFGCVGAYACGSKLLVETLINSARSLIYSTALPAADVAAARAALRLVRAADGARERLSRLAVDFRARLQGAGLDTGHSASPIVPWIVGSSQAALAAAAELEARGVLGVAVRPPTVPAGRARIRFTLTAAHTEDEVAWAAEQVLATARALGLAGAGVGAGGAGVGAEGACEAESGEPGS